MLDGLHEDLNRVKKKHYVETPEFEEDETDAVKAHVSWQYHLIRNQSVLVDLMHGQYKSTLHCPKCDRVSVNFDPFMIVSLPVP